MISRRTVGKALVLAPFLSPVARAMAGPSVSDVPPWQRFAVPPTNSDSRPRIAIIIDDLGLDRRRTAETIALSGQITAAFMSYATHLDAQTVEARSLGKELLLHVPMEPIDAKIDPGPGALRVAQPAEEIMRRLDAALASFSGYVGVNNHEGSRFTAYRPGMNLVIAEVARRGLAFVDSRTIGDSVGFTVARDHKVPAAGRDVFLDDDPNVPYVLGQLARTEAVARRWGTAIAIGHPKDATIAALTQWLPTLADKGLNLVPVTTVIRARATAA